MAARGAPSTTAGVRDLAVWRSRTRARPPLDDLGLCGLKMIVAVAAGHSIDPGRWQAEFDALMARIAPRFARVEPRRRARDSCWG